MRLYYLCTFLVGVMGMVITQERGQNFAVRYSSDNRSKSYGFKLNSLKSSLSSIDRVWKLENEIRAKSKEPVPSAHLNKKLIKQKVKNNPKNWYTQNENKNKRNKKYKYKQHIRHLKSLRFLWPENATFFEEYLDTSLKEKFSSSESRLARTNSLIESTVKDGRSFQITDVPPHKLSVFDMAMQNLEHLAREQNLTKELFNLNESEVNSSDLDRKETTVDSFPNFNFEMLPNYFIPNFPKQLTGAVYPSFTSSYKQKHIPQADSNWPVSIANETEPHNEVTQFTLDPIIPMLPFYFNLNALVDKNVSMDTITTLYSNNSTNWKFSKDAEENKNYRVGKLTIQDKDSNKSKLYCILFGGNDQNNKPEIVASERNDVTSINSNTEPIIENQSDKSLQSREVIMTKFMNDLKSIICKHERSSKSSKFKDYNCFLSDSKVKNLPENKRNQLLTSGPVFNFKIQERPESAKKNNDANRFFGVSKIIPVSNEFKYKRKRVLSNPKMQSMNSLSSLEKPKKLWIDLKQHILDNISFNNFMRDRNKEKRDNRMNSQTDYSIDNNIKISKSGLTKRDKEDPNDLSELWIKKHLEVFLTFILIMLALILILVITKYRKGQVEEETEDCDLLLPKLEPKTVRKKSKKLTIPKNKDSVAISNRKKMQTEPSDAEESSISFEEELKDEIEDAKLKPSKKEANELKENVSSSKENLAKSTSLQSLDKEKDGSSMDSNYKKFSISSKIYRNDKNAPPNDDQKNNELRTSITSISTIGDVHEFDFLKETKNKIDNVARSLMKDADTYNLEEFRKNPKIIKATLSQSSREHVCHLVNSSMLKRGMKILDHDFSRNLSDCSMNPADQINDKNHHTIIQNYNCEGHGDYKFPPGFENSPKQLFGATKFKYRLVTKCNPSVVDSTEFLEYIPELNEKFEDEFTAYDAKQRERRNSIKKSFESLVSDICTDEEYFPEMSPSNMNRSRGKMRPKNPNSILKSRRSSLENKSKRRVSFMKRDKLSLLLNKESVLSETDLVSKYDFDDNERAERSKSRIKPKRQRKSFDLSSSRNKENKGGGGGGDRVAYAGTNPSILEGNLDDQRTYNICNVTDGTSTKVTSERARDRDRTKIDYNTDEARDIMSTVFISEKLKERKKRRKPRSLPPGVEEDEAVQIYES